MDITQEQFERLNKSNNQTSVLKKIIGTKPYKRYYLGDTAVQIKGAKPLEVYKQTWNNKDIYYLVSSVIDGELVFTYSLYPLA